MNFDKKMKTEKKKLKQLLVAAVAAVAMLLMVACDSDTPQKPQSQAAELITGRSAFQKVYISARGWQADAEPFRLSSQPTSDANGQGGKADVWMASFGSPSQHLLKTFAWCDTSVSDAPDRGVTQAGQDSYSPGNSSTHAFNVGFIKIDSDAAFDEAQKHGGDKLLQQDPKTPVMYVLDWSSSTNELIWHVIYGSSRASAKLTVAVNATTGAFIRVEK